MLKWTLNKFPLCFNVFSLKSLYKPILNPTGLFLNILGISFSIQFYTFEQFLVALFAQISTLLVLTCFMFTAIIGLTMATILTMTLYLRIGSINISFADILLPRNFNNQTWMRRYAMQYLKDHNKLCCDVNDINKWWQSVTLGVLVTMIPVHLLLMHQFLFEDIEPLIKLFYLLSLIFIFLMLFVSYYVYALISVKMHRMSKILSIIQWNIERMDLRLKLEIMTYFERLNHQKRIGLKIGTFFVMTYPILAKVLSVSLNRLIFCNSN